MNWKMSEIKRLDTKTRKLLTMHIRQLPKADVDRLYLPRRIEGIGLTKLETAYESTMVGLKTYLRNIDDALFQLVLQYGIKKTLYSIKKRQRNSEENLRSQTSMGQQMNGLLILLGE